jgi:hypothetical protein
MYGIDNPGPDGQSVIFHFASQTSRDAWVVASKNRQSVDSDEELDRLEIGKWTKNYDLPAGAILAAPIRLSQSAAGSESLA